MIHVFHGFLGSPADFSFLKRDDVVIHDLYSMNAHPEIGHDDILIGYSMGGRIALEIAQKMNFNLKKIVLINAHPGLATEEEKMNRVEFETKVVQELKNRTREDFLSWWNDLPIFTHDFPLDVDEIRFKESAELFERYRLSKQQNFLPIIAQHKNKVLFIVGLFDEKYMELSEEVLMPEDIKVKGIPGGHRLFQEQTVLKKVLMDEGVL